MEKQKITILLSTDFMFTEEISSRLKALNYRIINYIGMELLTNQIKNNIIDLAIVDLQHRPSAGFHAIELLIENKIPYIAFCQHKSEKIIQKAKSLNINYYVNSQISKSLENIVNQSLKISLKNFKSERF